MRSVVAFFPRSAPDRSHAPPYLTPPLLLTPPPCRAYHPCNGLARKAIHAVAPVLHGVARPSRARPWDGQECPSSRRLRTSLGHC